MPGKTGVLFTGTTTEINALSGMSAGSMAWDTTLKVLKKYSGQAWEILDVDHGQLSGKGDDDHPEYLRLGKAGQTLTENLSVTDGKTIDGRDLSVDGEKIDSLPALRFMATPVNKISWTAATDWTDVNISANTGSDTAKAALLATELRFQHAAITDTIMQGLFRKNGSSETAILPRILLRSYDERRIAVATTIIVECDASEIFEVKLQTDLGTPLVIEFKVDLIGYFI